MVAPFSHDEIIILGGINKNLMKLGNGIILNTTNMTAGAVFLKCQCSLTVLRIQI